MRLLTKTALSLFVAGATTTAAFSQAPAQPAAPAGQPAGQPGVAPTTQPGAPSGQPGVTPGGQLPRPAGIQQTPAPIGPAPGGIAPPPGQIGVGNPQPAQPVVPGQPGAPQNQPLPGQPGAPQNQPLPGQPGAPQTQPIPGQPGAPQTQPIPGQPGAQPQVQPGAQPNGTRAQPQSQPGATPPVVPGTQIQQGQPVGQAQPNTAQPNSTNPQVQATANLGGFGNFGVNASSPFFADQSIRTGLNLSEQQFGALNQFSTRMMTDFRSQIDKLGNNLSDAERSAKTQELWNNFNTEVMTNAAKVLKPEQLERFRQVALQYRGIDAFRDPTVQQKLTLTDDQQSHLRSVREAFQKQAANIGQLAQTNREEATQKWQALQKEMMTRVNGVLTADQQKQWAQLIGEPVQFSFSASATNGQP